MTRPALDAHVMAKMVQEKFNLRLDRDRELIRQLTVVYIIQGHQRPPPCVADAL